MRFYEKKVLKTILSVICIFSCLILVSCNDKTNSNINVESSVNSAIGQEIQTSEDESLYTHQLLAGKKKNSDSVYTNYRIPGIVVTEKDTVIMYCEARKSTSDWGEIDILAFRSVDGGNSWDDPIVLAKGTDRELTMNNPVMIVGKDNVIHLLYCVNYGICTKCNTSATSSCTHGSGVFYRKSIDDGENWSEPINISDSTAPDIRNVIATGPGHGIVLSNGTLIVPVWMVKKEEKSELESHRPSIVTTLYSTDNGNNWKLGEFVPNGVDDQVVPSPSETAIVECSDGSVLLNMRTNYGGYRAIARSQTGYSDWSKMKFDESLIDPTCMGSLFKYDIKGDPYTILFTNCENDSKRENLVLKGSVDNGKTWTMRKVIDSGAAGYSDIAVDSNGKIYIIYEVNAGETVNLTHLDYDDLYLNTYTVLKDLEVKGISEEIKFNPVSNEYVLYANYNKKITIKAVPLEKEASIIINEKEYSSGSDFNYKFTTENNTVLIKISYKGKTNTYTLKFKFDSSNKKMAAVYLNGENYNDQSLFNNNITVSEGLKLDDKKYVFGKGSYQFNGNSSRIDISSINGANIASDNFTISIWVSFNKLTSSYKNQQIVFWYGGFGAGQPQLWCRSNNSDLQCNIASNGKENILTAKNVLSTNRWHHIAFVRDGVNIYLYLDNSLVESAECLFVHNIKSEDVMSIGACRDLSSTDRMFNGYIDEFRIYNYALSKEQIELLYRNDVSNLSKNNK